MFDPLSPELIGNPYPFYDRLCSRSGAQFAARLLRAQLPCRREHGPPGQALRQGFRRPSYATSRRPNPGRAGLPLDAPLDADADLLDHTRLRGLVVQAFTARRIEDMRPRIQQIVVAMLDRIAPRRHADLIADFAFRLPVTVICEMLGIHRTITRCS